MIASSVAPIMRRGRQDFNAAHNTAGRLDATTAENLTAEHQAVPIRQFVTG
jgi:hypothetical protein